MNERIAMIEADIASSEDAILVASNRQSEAGKEVRLHAKKINALRNNLLDLYKAKPSVAGSVPAAKTKAL